MSGWVHLGLVALAAAACGGGDGGASGPDADLDLTPQIAAPGQRCDPAERIGVVEISESGASAFMFNKPDPMVGEPALADASCAFHQYRPAAPCECAPGDICSQQGRCVAAPLRPADGRLTLRAGDQEQTFTAESEFDLLGGAITIPGPAYSVEVFGFGQLVTLEAETAVPDELTGLTATLEGSYDAPLAVDASWDPVDDGAHVFTRIPINHHAGGSTFTECAVETSAGALRVERAMLEPLAVATGLEFQGLEHVRFAAAETSRGCVEIRFSWRGPGGI